MNAHLTFAIIYIVGLIVFTIFAYINNTDRHWAERLGTVVMCLFWYACVGAAILVTIALAWDRYAYRKRGKATGDWRP